jgi:hypothetical protein
MSFANESHLPANVGDDELSELVIDAKTLHTVSVSEVTIF